MADSESLFINDDSDEETTSQRSRSGSPQNWKAVNGDAPQLNAAATSFNPFAPTNSGPPNTSSFQPTATFGRPSSTSSTVRPPTNSTSMFSLDSKPATQETSDGKGKPKFDFLAAANAKKGGDSIEVPKASGSKKFPALNSLPSTSTAEPTNDNTKSSPFGTGSAGRKEVFGRPSTALPAIKPSESAHSTFNVPASSNATTVPSQPQDVTDQTSASPAPLSLMSGTSPLFAFGAPKESDKTGQVAGSSVSPDLKGKAPETATMKPKDEVPKHSIFPTTMAPAWPTPTPFAPKTQPAETAPSNRTAPPKPSTASFPSFSSTTTSPALPFSKPDGTSAPLQPTPFSPKSEEADIAFSSTNKLQTSAQQKLQGPDFLNASKSKPYKIDLSQPSQDSIIPRQPQPSPRSLLLDKISTAVMLEDNGLLQQFIEFTVGPIITSSIIQLEDEESWEEARQSSPHNYVLGEPLLIRSRELSCNLIEQKVF